MATDTAQPTHSAGEADPLVMAPVAFKTAMLAPVSKGYPATSVHVSVLSGAYVVSVSQTGALGSIAVVHGPLASPASNTSSSSSTANSGSSGPQGNLALAQASAMASMSAATKGISTLGDVPVLVPRQILGLQSTFMDLFAMCVAEELKVIPEDPSVLENPIEDISLDADGSAFVECTRPAPVEAATRGMVLLDLNESKREATPPCNVDKTVVFALALVDQPVGEEHPSDVCEAVLSQVKKWIAAEDIARMTPLSNVKLV